MISPISHFNTNRCTLIWFVQHYVGQMLSYYRIYWDEDPSIEFNTINPYGKRLRNYLKLIFEPCHIKRYRMQEQNGGLWKIKAWYIVIACIGDVEQRQIRCDLTIRHDDERKIGKRKEMEQAEKKKSWRLTFHVARIFALKRLPIHSALVHWIGEFHVVALSGFYANIKFNKRITKTLLADAPHKTCKLLQSFLDLTLFISSVHTHSIFLVQR